MLAEIIGATELRFRFRLPQYLPSLIIPFAIRTMHRLNYKIINIISNNTVKNKLQTKQYLILLGSIYNYLLKLQNNNL